MLTESVESATFCPSKETPSGLKDGVDVEGAPVSEKAMLPENPFNEVSVTMYCALCPGSMVREGGEAAILKSAFGVPFETTVRVARVKWILLLLDPVMFKVYVPGEVLESVAIFRVEVKGHSLEFG